MRDRSATYGRISCAPSEQLTPTISGSACSIDVQNASIVCPVSVAAGEVDDRDADPERELGRGLARGDDRRLRVQRVEDRLDQQQVDAAVREAADLLGVRRLHLVEGVRAVPGLVDPRRQRQRDVQRPDRAGDEPPLAGRLARDARAGDVHVVDRVVEPVVGLPDRRGRERVRRRDVGARREVRVVHLAHDLRLRQVEQVRVVLDVARVAGEALAAEVGLGEAAALQQHAPGAVEHEDPLLCELPDLRCDVARHVNLPRPKEGA